MLRVRTTFDGFSGGPGLFTVYFSVPSEDASACERMRSNVHDLIGGCLGALLSNSMTWTVNHEVDFVTEASGDVTNTEYSAVNHTATGGGGTGFAPMATAALISWQTSTWYGGRRAQGRSYISPLAPAVIAASGQLDETTAGVREVALAGWRTGLATGDHQVVWHRPKGGTGGATATVNTQVVKRKLAVLTSRRD